MTSSNTQSNSVEIQEELNEIEKLGCGNITILLGFIWGKWEMDASAQSKNDVSAFPYFQWRGENVH